MIGGHCQPDSDSEWHDSAQIEAPSPGRVSNVVLLPFSSTTVLRSVMVAQTRAPRLQVEDGSQLRTFTPALATAGRE